MKNEKLKIKNFWSSEGRAMLASAMPSRDKIAEKSKKNNNTDCRTFWSSERRAMLASAMPSRDKIAEKAKKTITQIVGLFGAARAERCLHQLCRVATKLPIEKAG